MADAGVANIAGNGSATAAGGGASQGNDGDRSTPRPSLFATPPSARIGSKAISAAQQRPILGKTDLCTICPTHEKNAHIKSAELLPAPVYQRPYRDRSEGRRSFATQSVTPCKKRGLRHQARLFSLPRTFAMLLPIFTSLLIFTA